ncbi:OLC1v1034992C1 [Oldenlandia corymbosa var. corymbosa]|uniref:Laccase n=1 Tax=Oldenlandia corymbosa var. corymbosa TaxID=529605 RepID=A0AAV1CSN7_OLDCO|nr:OLC1v1034992C1 [Oldenlandia corymbosa var. corymbosa]
MGQPVLISMMFALVFSACLSTFASAAVVEHQFEVKDVTVNRLCKDRTITTVNGNLPGPTLLVREGDTLVIHVTNKSPYNITLHWHGVTQFLSAWADGPEYITQCPIIPGNSYTYKFKVTKQEGTLWWHAHISFLRETVYGAIVIRPRAGRTYPFPKPFAEFPILFGEWWDGNIVDIIDTALANGGPPVNSAAFTINGQPGVLYNCSSNQTYRMNVIRGKTYLLRIVNAAINAQLFFKIANHKFTVVAVDAAYTNPYVTDVIAIAPGQSVDALLVADQKPGLYYMAARPYTSAPVATNNSTTTAILAYAGSPRRSKPLLPDLPAERDTATAAKFYTDLTALVTSPYWTGVPQTVDEDMFVTVGMGIMPCEKPGTCNGPLQQRFASSMNNVSFLLPSRMSLLEASVRNVSGIYTTDFPKQPPVVFDYTSPNSSFNPDIIRTTKSTKIIKVKYNTTVQMVLQNQIILGPENHPMHLHGFNFYVLAQGFGNYDASRDSKNFNLVNAQERNTVAVPSAGWAVIRFRANNPGVWFMHCHVEAHVPWGLATAIEVENGPTPSTTLPPPPADLPKC